MAVNDELEIIWKEEVVVQGSSLTGVPTVLNTALRWKLRRFSQQLDYVA